MFKFLSKRGQVSKFIVMDLFEEAQNLSKKGKKIIHFEAGQPTAKLPNSAFKEALNKIKTTNVSYTSPVGLDLLKKKISNYYLKKHKTKIDHKKIIITFGSSGQANCILINEDIKIPIIPINITPVKRYCFAIILWSWLKIHFVMKVSLG